MFQYRNIARSFVLRTVFVICQLNQHDQATNEI